MTKEQMIFWRNFLFNTFLVLLVFALVILGVIFSFWDTWMGIAEKYTPFDKNMVAGSVLNSIVIVRQFALMFFICPVIALHLMIRRKKPE